MDNDQPIHIPSSERLSYERRYMLPTNLETAKVHAREFGGLIKRFSPDTRAILVGSSEGRGILPNDC